MVVWYHHCVATQLYDGAITMAASEISLHCWMLMRMLSAWGLVTMQPTFSSGENEIKK